MSRIRILLAMLLAALGAAPAAAAPLLSYPALSIPGSPERGTIRVRATAPAGHAKLPVILFSHGATYSGDDYRALADDWAAHGYLVLQPTHLDSRALATPADDPRQPRIWRLRRDDMVAILDHLDAIAAQAPALAGRIDATRIVAIGHSYGGHTTALLLGATTRNPQTGAREDLADPRIRGGILLSAPGGWDGVGADWRRKAPFLDVDWSTMRRPVLVMYGALDASVMSTRDARWHEDPFARAPAGRVCLVALAHAGHFLGGIGHAGPPAARDPNDPPSAAIVHGATLAWLSRLMAPGGERAWRREQAQLARSPAVAQALCR